MKEENKGRKPRRQAKRKGGRVSELRLTDRDKDILRLVYEHRFLDTELLLRLLRPDNEKPKQYKIGRDGKRRPTSYGFGQKALYRRLKILSDKRYLVRRPLADEFIGRGYAGPKAVFGLGSKSAVPLSKTLDVTPKDIREIVEANRVGHAFMRHALLIARFRVTLELACRKSDGRVRLVFWAQSQQLRDSVYGLDENREERRFTVYPDAFFAIEVRGKGKANYFLEIDRGTEVIASSKHRTDIRSKVMGYRYYHKSKYFARRYSYLTLPDGTAVGLRVHPAGDAADTDGHVRGFQVLFVTKGTLKPDGSISGRIANIVSALPTFGEVYAKSPMFLLTTFDAIDLEAPETILAPIWSSARKRGTLASLIE